MLAAPILFILFKIYGAHPLNYKPNEYWTCPNCVDRAHADRLHGVIRTAVMREQRNAFLALEMSWLDRILLSETKVTVHLLPHQHMGRIVVPALKKLPASAGEETFQVAIAELPDKSAASFSPADVDLFLRENPCWMPIHGLDCAMLFSGCAAILI